MDDKGNNPQSSLMKNLSLRKILIGGSVLAYLVGVILGVVTWLFARQYIKDLEWNWEIIYGPLIAVASCWLFGGLIVLFVWARMKGKAKKITIEE